MSTTCAHLAMSHSAVIANVASPAILPPKATKPKKLPKTPSKKPFILSFFPYFSPTAITSTLISRVGVSVSRKL